MSKRRKRKATPAIDTVWAGWDLSPSEVAARMKRSPKPFWADWNQERIESVDELHQALTLRCAKSLATAFDPARIARAPAPHLSHQEREVYDRLIRWLKEMHDAGLKRYIRDIVGQIVCDDPIRDRGLFYRAISLHVDLRRREAQRRNLTRRISGSM